MQLKEVSFLSCCPSPSDITGFWRLILGECSGGRKTEMETRRKERERKEGRRMEGGDK